MKPVLSDNAPTIIDFCSCGGGVLVGGVLAGFRPSGSVEMNPKDPSLSQHYSLVHRQNFGEYGSNLQLRTVQEAQANNYDGIIRNPTVFHASPPCTNYSKLRTLNNYSETIADVEIGEAIGNGIIQLTPNYFTLECSSSYKDGLAFQAVKQGLEIGGYDFRCYEVDFQDYNTPQSRKRLIVLGWRKGLKPFKMPPKRPLIGWGNAIGPSAERRIVEATKNQQKTIDAYLETNLPTPIMVDKVGISKNYIYREASQPMWTILAAMFTDQRKGERNSTLTYYEYGKMYALTIRDIARLCGFPDWYALSENYSLAGSVLGNAVCPSFYGYLLAANRLV